ncbi:peptidoglycan DD-metalloendopeptidase family protein [Candidatus Uhrbacteria bacterium]|nr:peptidoglycan DD-metalloendopeptidase family protein [Candidatus Uhrbacteria bacterium]
MHWKEEVRKIITLTVGIAMCVGNFSFTPVSAATDAKQEVDQLNSQIKNQQSRVKELDGVIAKYRQRIADQEKEQSTLANDVLILDNRITETELNIERTKANLETTKLTIQSLEEQIEDQNERIGGQKQSAADLVRRIYKADNVPTFEVLLSKPSLSSFFDRLEEEKRVQRELFDAIEKVKTFKQSLEETHKDLDGKRIALENDKKNLKRQQEQLEEEKNFKISLAAETKLKQSEYERVLYELNEQQQSTADEISKLKDTLKDKLDSIDLSLARGDVLLNWPLKPIDDIYVTAHFHDPTYPFRQRFAHPGTDLRAKVGTPIYAAAGGYVAWTKTGSAYGNYLMIVHPGNIATIYAHLSKFIAKPDTYVQRGDLLGLSGGMPGQQGAGLSTGPHLHFEVRQNGIPVNAENFLPTLPNDDEE